ncbi:unnamed protein product [Linum trigynum]|uniref:Uncharacterized protein n=1 Tax=Linum trigynum TaxID=586398 RepID=A0AAV2DKL6_9ROSI
MSERRGKEKSRVLGRNVTVSERKKRQEESDRLREEERQEKISLRQAAVVPPPHSHVSQPLPGINTYDDMVEDDDSSDDECDVEGDDELSFHELLFDGHPGGSSDHVSTGSTHGSTVVGRCDWCSNLPTFPCMATTHLSSSPLTCFLNPNDYFATLANDVGTLPQY